MPDQIRDELIWGVQAIAHEIQREPRQTYHLLSTGELPVAKKVGGRWVVSRQRLRAFFAGEAA
jgi:hypothetical protein